MDTLDVLIKITLTIKHFVTSLTGVVRAFLAPPNMTVSPLSSCKTFLTLPTLVSTTHPLVRLYLYYSLLPHSQVRVYIHLSISVHRGI